MSQSFNGLGGAAGLGECGPELEMNRRRPRLFLSERLEQCECGLQLTGEALCRAEDESGARIARSDAQNFLRLLCSQRRALTKQMLRVCECDLQGSSRLRCSLSSHAENLARRSRVASFLGGGQARLRRCKARGLESLLRVHERS